MGAIIKLQRIEVVGSDQHSCRFLMLISKILYVTLVLQSLHVTLNLHALYVTLLLHARKGHIQNSSRINSL